MYCVTDDFAGKADALGNTSNGVHYETGPLEIVRFEDAAGNVIEIRNENGELHLMGRNGRLLVRPEVSNHVVIEHRDNWS